MRIAIFSDTYFPQVNGVTNTLMRMKEYMDAKGIEYRFFVPAENNESENRDHVSPIVHFSSWKLFFYPECKVTKPQYKKIAAVLDDFKPDLIHVVTPFTMGLMGLKYSKTHRTPLVTSYHTNFSAYLKSYRLEFLQKTMWSFFRWFHSHSLVNFCPSQETLQQLEQQGIEHVKIWGRGIDTKTFSPAFYHKEKRSQYVANGEKMLLYVGRLAAEKKLDVLMESVHQLNQAGSAFKLVMVGDGPLRAQIEQMNIPNVILTGYQSGIELQTLYASSDLFVFPSDTETYGNVVLEAMASGLPVVAPLAGGIKENLRPMYNGLSYEASSASELTAAVQSLLTDDSLRKSLGHNARRHCEGRSWSCIFDELFDEYEQALRQEASHALRLLA